ncbi:hypothetical protein DRN69_01580 [Candidatus Pacearchaeota archaeon]|nr:MAG: hypothetical protein DRN69_01580 [Candidatus Pacearchaeota archaeon]
MVKNGKNRKILNLIERGYREFINLANDLSEAKKERIKAQYYTGTKFLKEQFRKKSIEFLRDVVNPYIEKINKLLSEKND